MVSSAWKIFRGAFDASSSIFICGATPVAVCDSTGKSVTIIKTKTAAQRIILIQPPGETFEYTSALALSSRSRTVLYDLLRERRERQVHNIRRARRLRQKHSARTAGRQTARTWLGGTRNPGAWRHACR